MNFKKVYKVVNHCYDDLSNSKSLTTTKVNSIYNNLVHILANSKDKNVQKICDNHLNREFGKGIRTKSDTLYELKGIVRHDLCGEAKGLSTWAYQRMNQVKKNPKYYRYVTRDYYQHKSYPVLSAKMAKLMIFFIQRDMSIMVSNHMLASMGKKYYHRDVQVRMLAKAEPKSIKKADNPKISKTVSPKNRVNRMNLNKDNTKTESTKVMNVSK